MKEIQCIGGVIAVRKTKSNKLTYCLVKSITETEGISRECYSLLSWQDDSVAFFFDLCSDFEKAEDILEMMFCAEVSPTYLADALEEL